jgi:hypothetical protein
MEGKDVDKGVLEKYYIEPAPQVGGKGGSNLEGGKSEDS